MDVEQRARELLAAEYAKGQFRAYAPEIRSGAGAAFDEEIRAIVAIIAALTPPEGYVLAPINPTRDMVVAGVESESECKFPSEIYAAMLAARPEVKP